MKHRTLFLLLLGIYVCEGTARAEVVVGKRPDQYGPVNPASLDWIIKKGKAGTLTPLDILKQSAQIHADTEGGATSTVSPLATVIPALQDQPAASCPSGFNPYMGEIADLWDPIIGNPGYPVPNSVQCIQKVKISESLVSYTGMRVIEVNGQPQGVTISSKFGPPTGMIVQYFVSNGGRARVYHNYFVKSFDDVTALKTTLSTGDKITYDGVAPDSSCAANPKTCISDPAKTGYQLQVETTIGTPVR